MDNIGTGWSFPVKVALSGPAKVRSDSTGPFNFTSFPAGGGYLYISMNGEHSQIFNIPVGIFTANQIVTALASLRGGVVTNESGYIVIKSDEDNPIKSSIEIQSLADLSDTVKRDVTNVLGLPRGTVKGFGTGKISMTRNPDPDLVTPDETFQELGEALLCMFLTSPGEMPMVRGYGVGLWDRVFKPVNAQYLGALKYSMVEGVMAWDDRVSLATLDLVQDGTDVYATVGYQAKGQQGKSDLVVPLDPSSV